MKKFKTPHEKSKSKSKPAPAPEPSPAPAEQPKAEKANGRDAFGGRIGTRMSKINLAVINAGEKGATVPEVAAQTKESVSIVSAQLGWIHSHHKKATRKEEVVDGKTVFRYFRKENN